MVAAGRTVSLSGPRSGSPPPQRDDCADRFDDAKRPGTLRETVRGSERARGGEQQHEPRARMFERVGDEHQRYSKESEQRKRRHDHGPFVCDHIRSTRSHIAGAPINAARPAPERPCIAIVIAALAGGHAVIVIVMTGVVIPSLAVVVARIEISRIQIHTHLPRARTRLSHDLSHGRRDP